MPLQALPPDQAPGPPYVAHALLRMILWTWCQHNPFSFSDEATEVIWLVIGRSKAKHQGLDPEHGSAAAASLPFLYQAERPLNPPNFKNIDFRKSDKLVYNPDFPRDVP